MYMYMYIPEDRCVSFSREKRAASDGDSTQGVLINRVTQGNTDNLSYIELV